MVITEETFFGGLSVIGAIVGWLLTLEKRLNARLTRREHTDICETNNKAVSNKLDYIVRRLDKQDNDSMKHREATKDELNYIKTKVAVLRERQTKNGDDEDTGAHRRRL